MQTHSSRGSDGKTSTSYSFNFKYRYEYSGRTCAGNVYNPTAASFSSWSDANSIDDQFPPGAQVDCFVNPAEPLDAALARDLPDTVWFGAFPMLFAVAGFVGLACSLGVARDREESERRST